MTGMLTYGSGDQSVYVYYFKSQSKDRAYWPCKIGGTSSADPYYRVRGQQASMQEKPVIGLHIKTDNWRRDEAILHALFEHRKLDTYGREWFETQPQHILNAFRLCKMDMTLGQQLKVHRCSQGMTQMELAECSGIRQGTISFVERGRPSKVSTLLELARELKLKVVLVDDDDAEREMPAPPWK